jgi:uncharacterized protein (UPF0332 family)
MAGPAPCKAKRTHAEAQTLFDQQYYCGAANRAYYAFFQTVVATLERFALTPSSVARQLNRRDFCDPKDPQRWFHPCVIESAEKWVTPNAKTLLKNAFSLRRKADYGKDPVERDELEVVLKRLPDFLTAAEKRGVTFADGPKPVTEGL